MNLELLTAFFLWSTIINGGILILFTVVFLTASDFAYRTHSRFFQIPRETYDVIIYSLLGGFKLLFILFNLVPWLASVIVG